MSQKLSETQIDEKIRFLESILGKCKFNKIENKADFYCVFCEHHKRKLTIKIDIDIWGCWVCKQSGKGLQKIFRHLHDEKNLELYNKHYNTVSNKTSYVENTQAISIKLPSDFTPLTSENNSFVFNKAKEYLDMRGIEQQDILKYKLGVCLSDEKFKNRVIFPSFDKNGNLNYFIGRDIFNGPIKYSNVHVYKGYKNTIILNELNIDFTKPLVLVEGFFDLLKSIPNTTPLGSNDLSERSLLFDTIVKTKTDVFIALDTDAKARSLEIAGKLMRFGVNCHLVNIEPFKDPGAMTKKEFAIRFEAAEQIIQSDILLNRMTTC